MSRGDASYLKDPSKNLSYTFPDHVLVEDPEHWVKGGDSIKTCGLDFTVIDTPGHTPGGISFYEAKKGIVFTGDSLFHGSIGRTDFPGGSMTTLVTAIRKNLFCLPDTVTVLSGHGDPTNHWPRKEDESLPSRRWPMRWGAEFWMRIGIALFFFGLVVAAPMILFPFTVSLVLAILLIRWRNSSMNISASAAGWRRCPMISRS